MYIPDAFTPNGDGLNTSFNPSPFGVNASGMYIVNSSVTGIILYVKGAGFLEEGFEMRIYDRWGELIFKTNNVYEGWNGKVKGVDAKNDVYVYKIRCFTTVKNIKKEFVGHVTLYR
jgi:gliding motility-associated-like protein